MSVLSSSGQPGGGTLVNGTFTIIAGYPVGTAPWPPGSLLIDVSGTISEPATILVNGIPATVTGTTFLAQGILLVEGPNTITATATDPAGNVGVPHSITVYLDTQPPAMPTVSTHLEVLTATSYTLCGTKTSNTSIWINGVEVVPLDQATTWCANVQNLIEGDNIVSIIAHDAAGNPSANATANLLVDNLPPVVSQVSYLDTQSVPLNLDPGTSLPKTNFTPVTIAGQVDDSLTTVMINGVTASRSGLAFTAAVPLALGTNALNLVATSPNGYVTTQTLSVIQGTIPTVTFVQPPDASKAYESTTVTIQATATDNENDPLQYELLVDGQVVSVWSAGNTATWNPTVADVGLHTIEARVKDGFGGGASQSVETYVVRQPVPPP